MQTTHTHRVERQIRARQRRLAAIDERRRKGVQPTTGYLAMHRLNDELAVQQAVDEAARHRGIVPVAWNGNGDVTAWRIA
jgi:hypothetical protein